MVKLGGTRPRPSMGKHRGGFAFSALNYTILVLLAIITLFPFYITFINSISPPEDFIFKRIIIFPSRAEFGYYRYILGNGSGLLVAFRVTVIVTVLGTLLNIVMTSITAFALSKKDLPGRTQITLFMVITMYFSGGMIPTYLVVQSLHLINKFSALIIPSAVYIGYVLFLRNFFMTIPTELVDAASIDGCSGVQILYKIILPLSAPAIATFTLFYAVSHWNDLYSGLLYISDSKMQPLQVYLRQVLYDVTISGDPREMQKLMSSGMGLQPPAEGMKAATIMAATVPIVCIYPFLQKHFVTGMMMGSLKG